MALLKRVCCWKLRTATVIGFIYIFVTASSALLMRALDFSATVTDFSISRGFDIPWRSHQWQFFLAGDIIVSICHVACILYTIFMFYNVTLLHFVLYMKTMQWYTYCFIMYTFIEFCFSFTEFTFYGLNTFRREYLVFLWLWWIFRIIFNSVFALVLFSRTQEMEEEMALELRHSGKKYVHSYT